MRHPGSRQMDVLLSTSNHDALRILRRDGTFVLHHRRTVRPHRRTHARSRPTFRIIGKTSTTAGRRHAGRQMLLATPLLKWYLEHGGDHIYQVVEFMPHRCFRSFVKEVSDGQRLGDAHPDKAIIGNTKNGEGNRFPSPQQRHSNVPTEKKRVLVLLLQEESLGRRGLHRTPGSRAVSNQKRIDGRRGTTHGSRRD